MPLLMQVCIFQGQNGISYFNEVKVAGEARRGWVLRGVYVFHIENEIYIFKDYQRNCALHQPPPGAAPGS